MSITNTEVTLRLILALILGGLIGLERESMRRPAGFRTHILVSIGSALLMMVSAYAFHEFMGGRYDPGRIAAQVVSGIGFLGAGTIMREGINVRGLTTAASLWIVAGIGLASGAGFYYGAVLASFLTMLALVLLDRFELDRIRSKHEVLDLVIRDTPGQLARVFAVLAKHRVNVFNVELSTEEDSDEAGLSLKIKLPPMASRTKIIEDLISTPGIKHAKYH